MGGHRIQLWRWASVVALVATVTVGQGVPAHAGLERAPAASGTLQAAFTYAPLLPYINETITLTDDSTGNDVDQSWDLNGDGVFGDAAGKQVTVSFKTAGKHVIGLQIDSAKAGPTSTVTHTIVVGARPTVAIHASPAGPFAGQLVTLATSTTGDVVRYAWDLNNDGKFDDATTPTTTTRFRTAGLHRVRVEVADSRGTVATGELDVQVGAPQNPTSVVTLKTAAPKAGEPTILDASGSKPGPGAHIVDYRWDLTGKGDFHTDTGSNSVLDHIFTAGAHTVHEESTDSNGNSDETTIQFTVGSGVCHVAQLGRGLFDAVAACITRTGDTFNLTPARSPDGGYYEVLIDGLAVHTQSSSNRIHINPTARTITSDGPVSLWFDSTSIGNIELWGSGTAPLDIHMGTGASGGVVQLLTVGAGQGCSASTGVACATLPGSFPLTGLITLSIDPTNDQLVADANVGLTSPINATASIRLRADLFNGLYMDQLTFSLQNNNWGPVLLNTLYFHYEPRGTGSPIHDGDLWDARVSATLLGIVQATGELKFIDGQFNYGSLEVDTHDVGIPVFPGVVLNDFGAQFGEDPLHVGGTLGALVADILQINGTFVYERAGAVDHFQVSGTASFLNQPIASATFDYYSDGFIEINAGIGWQTPYPSDNPDLQVGGQIGFWMEDEADGSYRFQGTGAVTLTIGGTGPIGGQGLVNNDWIAGCIGVPKTIWGLYGAWNIPGAYFVPGVGCDLTGYQISPLSHSARMLPHVGEVRAAGATTFRLAAGEPAVNLSIYGQGGVPSVTITSPTGQVYHPATSGGFVHTGGWATVPFTDRNLTVLGVKNPPGGTWTITPNSGSPAIARLVTSQIRLPATVHVAISGRGRNRMLRWNASHLNGQHITFVERAGQVAHTIGSTAKATGAMPFTIADGPAGKRRIEADLTDAGRPTSQVVAGQFTAPGFIKPGKPKHLVIRRHGLAATVSWHKARLAKGYVATIRGSDGRRQIRITKANVRHLTITPIEPFEGVKVTVKAYYSSPRNTGPGAHVRLASHPIPRVTKPRHRKHHHG